MNPAVHKWGFPSMFSEFDGWGSTVLLYSAASTVEKSFFCSSWPKLGLGRDHRDDVGQGLAIYTVCTSKGFGCRVRLFARAGVGLAVYRYDTLLLGPGVNESPKGKQGRLLVCLLVYGEFQGAAFSETPTATVAKVALC